MFPFPCFHLFVLPFTLSSYASSFRLYPSNIFSNVHVSTLGHYSHEFVSLERHLHETIKRCHTTRGHMMRFEKDLFISYAHIDNEPLIPEQLGWITQFHASLEALMSMRMRRKAGVLETIGCMGMMFSPAR